MFDAVTSERLRSAPPLSGLDPADLPKMLTEHYAQLVSSRLRGEEPNVAGADGVWTVERLADAYELIASVASEREIKLPAAFVAATARQIMGRRAMESSGQRSRTPGIDSEKVDPTVAAVLLFLAAEQYADAYDAALRINTAWPGGESEAVTLVENIADLARGRLSRVIARSRTRAPATARNRSLEDRAVASLFDVLSSGVAALAARLLGLEVPRRGDEAAISPNDAFARVRDWSSGVIELVEGNGPMLRTYPGPHHAASLLLAAGDGLAAAGLMRLPPPAGADPAFWHRWLALRAEHFPFIWPNHREAIHERFHETGRSAVVVLPTGAGKTTLSALKIAGVLARGKKVVFLAPTHALVDQLTEDLREMFPQHILGAAVSSDFDLLFSADGFN